MMFSFLNFFLIFDHEYFHFEASFSISRNPDFTNVADFNFAQRSYFLKTDITEQKLDLIQIIMKTVPESQSLL